VLDKLGEELVHRRQECFANLAPQENPSNLPNFDLGASAAFRLGLGLDKIADADLKAVGENRVILRFEDVTVQTISQGEFRQTIDRKACPEIGRLVDKNPDALKDGTLLVGELFRARVIVRLDRTRDDSAKVSTGWLTGIAQRFGLRVKAEAGGDLATAQSIELSSSKEPVAVAFRPAFIRLDPTQPGFKATEGRPDAPSIVPFNSDSEDDRLALTALIARQLPRVAGSP